MLAGGKDAVVLHMYTLIVTQWCHADGKCTVHGVIRSGHISCMEQHLPNIIHVLFRIKVSFRSPQHCTQMLYK